MQSIKEKANNNSLQPKPRDQNGVPLVTNSSSSRSSIMIGDQSSNLRSIFERTCMDCSDLFSYITFSFSLKNILPLRLVSTVFCELISRSINNHSSILTNKAIISFDHSQIQPKISGSVKNKYMFAQTNKIEIKVSSFCFSFSKLFNEASILKKEIDILHNNCIITLKIKNCRKLIKLHTLLLSDKISNEQKEILSSIKALDLYLYDLDNSNIDAATSLFQALRDGKSLLQQLTIVSLKTTYNSNCKIPPIPYLKTLEIEGDFDFEKFNFPFLELTEFSLLECNLPTILTLPYIQELKKLYLKPNIGLVLPSSNLLTNEEIDKNLSLIDTQYIECAPVRETACEIIVKDCDEKNINIFISIDDYLLRAECFKKKLDFYSKNTFSSTIKINTYDELIRFYQFLELGLSSHQKLILLKTNTLHLSFITIDKYSIEGIYLVLNKLATKDTPLPHLTSLKLGNIEVDFTLPDISELVNLEFAHIRGKLNLPNLLKLERLLLKKFIAQELILREKLCKKIKDVLN